MQRAKNGEFNWVDLSAIDLEKQSAFYEGLLGWKRNDMPMGDGTVYRMFAVDGHTVAGASEMPAEQRGSRPTAWNTYLMVDDIEATVKKAEELGGRVVMEPASVPDDSGMIAGIQDPTGAYVFFWKPQRQDDTVEYMAKGELSWSELETRDPQRAIDFYSNLLGWEVKEMSGGQMQYWVVNVSGEGEGGIMPMPEMVPPEVPSYWLPYFGTDDLKVSVDKAKQLGARVLSEPMEVPNMVEFSVLTDPAGAVFALMKPVPMTA